MPSMKLYFISLVLLIVSSLIGISMSFYIFTSTPALVYGSIFIAVAIYLEKRGPIVRMSLYMDGSIRPVTYDSKRFGGYGGFGIIVAGFLELGLGFIGSWGWGLWVSPLVRLGSTLMLITSGILALVSSRV